MKRDNKQHLFNATLLLCLCVISTRPCHGADEEGTGTAFTASQPISNGFVFVEGQYVEAPYVVSRKDLAIYINDRLIADYAPLVKDLPELDETQPALPSDVSTNANPEDPLLGNYLYRMGNYLASQRSRTTALAEMESVLKELPCVTNVRREVNPEYATVEFMNGRKVSMGLLPFRRRPAITSSSVLEHVSRDCRNYADRLQAGVVYSVSAKGSRKHSFGADTAMDVLPNVVKALRSSQDDETKAKQLADMLGMAAIPKEQASAFVTQISTTSTQLDERVKALTAAETADKGKRARADTD